MTRTNIDIDDELVHAVMTENGLRTKREAIDFALRKVRRKPVDRDALLALEGIGFDLGLDDIRRADDHRQP